MTDTFRPEVSIYTIQNSLSLSVLSYFIWPIFLANIPIWIMKIFITDVQSILVQSYIAKLVCEFISLWEMRIFWEECVGLTLSTLLNEIFKTKDGNGLSCPVWPVWVDLVYLYIKWTPKRAILLVSTNIELCDPSIFKLSIFYCHIFPSTVRTLTLILYHFSLLAMMIQRHWTALYLRTWLLVSMAILYLIFQHSKNVTKSCYSRHSEIFLDSGPAKSLFLQTKRGRHMLLLYDLNTSTGQGHHYVK